MGTKNNPGKFDCYEAAEPDEPMFVLLARDVDAPELVRYWASLRARRAQTTEDQDKVAEAQECAENMEKWRLANRS